MFFSGSKKQKERVVVLFDIGSASIAVGLLLLAPEKKPTLLYHTRRSMEFQKRLNFDRFFGSMKKTLSEVGNDLVKNGLPHLHMDKKESLKLDAVLCTYASPWYLSTTKVITVHEREPVTLTREFVQNILDREEKSLEGKGTYMGDLEKHLSVIERTVTGIQLNGYDVESPYGRDAQQIQITASITAVPHAVREGVEEVITNIIQGVGIVHHSFGVVATQAIQELVPKQKDFLFVDVSGEVTDVVRVEGGAVTHAISFPFGTQEMLRGITRDMKVDVHEAETLATMYEEKRLHEKARSTLSKLYEKLEMRWREEMSSALSRIVPAEMMPRHVYITAHTVFAPTFERFLKNVVCTDTKIKPNILSLMKGAVASHTTFKEQRIPDTFLALEALYVARAQVGSSV